MRLSQISQMGTTERLGYAQGRLHECSPKGERAGESESNDPSKLGLVEKSEHRSSLLAEFLFLPCPIRDANAPVPASIRVYPCNRCLNKKLVGKRINLVS